MTPQALVELMTHQVSLRRHVSFNGSGVQQLSSAVIAPCYIDFTKADQSPPSVNVYVGVTDDEAPMTQGDYATLTYPSSDGPDMWSVSRVQTWWDETGAVWCRQLTLDSRLEMVTIETPPGAPDEEGRATGWTTQYHMLMGLRPLSYNEQLRAAQGGQQVTLFGRYPSNIDIGRQHRIVSTQLFPGAYEVVTMETHDDARTVTMRRNEP